MLFDRDAYMMRYARVVVIICHHTLVVLFDRRSERGRLTERTTYRCLIESRIDAAGSVDIAKGNLVRAYTDDGAVLLE
jgi:hypothetical protein